MRIAITSDWHGYVPPEIPDCDLMIVAGDIGLDEKFGYEPERLLTDWYRWIEDCPVPIIAVAGNHDFRPEVLRALPWWYLEDEIMYYRGLTFWGTPWSNPFGHGWAFNMTEEDQARNLKRIPPVDVVISHGPPYGLGDLTAGWRNQPPQHVGSVALLDRMYEMPNLKLVACGHIHPAYGVHEGPNGIAVVNGALVNEEYKVANPPIVLDV